MNKTQKLNISLLCDIYGQLLTDKQREMLRLFYDYDNSLLEIAEQYGVTRQAVHDSINKAEETLNYLESKLHLFENGKRLLDAVRTIKAKLGDDWAAIAEQLSVINQVAGE